MMDGNSWPKNRYITPLINSLPGSHDLVIWNKIFVPWETPPNMSMYVHGLFVVWG